jgi:FHA domain-containing protein
MLARDLAQDLARAQTPASDALRAGAAPRTLPADAGMTELVPRSPFAPVPPEELWRAFQEGAGVQIELPHGLRPELMRTIGGMLRSVIGGVRRLVLMRAQAKTEVDAEVTMLRARNNNPLKFASDDTRALTALLKPPPAGFLPGPAAVEDAMNDLESHHAATQAAMRAAIEQLLLQFEPAALEKRLVRQGLFASLVPLGHKAKLWDLYVAQYRAIGSEAREGFREAFDRAFVAAYDAEVARIERERRRR